MISGTSPEKQAERSDGSCGTELFPAEGWVLFSSWGKSDFHISPSFAAAQELENIGAVNGYMQFFPAQLIKPALLTWAGSQR